MGSNGYIALADENGVFKHILVHTGNGLRPYCCESGLIVQKMKTADVPYSQTLTCKACETERSRWASFWDSQKERHPDEVK